MDISTAGYACVPACLVPFIMAWRALPSVMADFKVFFGAFMSEMLDIDELVVAVEPHGARGAG